MKPDGTMDAIGNRFWNATDACCNFDGLPVDDVAFLRGLMMHGAIGTAIGGLWALAVTYGLTWNEAQRGMEDPDAYVRAWTIQLETREFEQRIIGNREMQHREAVF